MIVQACLNGARPAAFHPALPTTPAALAADAEAAVAAGAAELHVHPRGPDGAESLQPAVIGAAVAAIRARLPGTPVGVSTGEWIERDEDRRLALIGGWKELPDYASVNLGEMGAPAVIERLRRLGVGIEAGLHTASDAERLVALGLGKLALRVLIEIDEQDLPMALAETEAIEAVLAVAGLRKPILLHGYDGTVWPLVRRAAERRYSTRVGLEDGAVLPEGTAAAGNAGLVAAAVGVVRGAR